ncbi:MAG: hypothetical protein IPK17_22685 [Chloroflexi bacterium]|uniref:helix-turn-helix domain-containing protein n=1 Tax=Candidatus Flexifilum breve TaxID=3140694 RepID=UPI003137454C|nr:hypothetical protein [Chloroflexota bacterium]
MPILTPHWDIMKRNGLFRKEEGAGSTLRFDVLMSLLGRANIRLRCWPSVETLINDLAVNDKTAVAAALKWLADHGAIYNVPKDKRVGKEKWLLPQKYVFQLTGVVKIGDEVMEYILMQEGEREAMIDELTELGAEYAVELYGLLEPKPEPDPEGEDGVGRETRPTLEGVGRESLPSSSGIPTELVGIPNPKALPDSSTIKAVAPPAAQSGGQPTSSTAGTSRFRGKVDPPTANGSKPQLNEQLLANHLSAVTGKSLNKDQRARLAKPVVIVADGMKREYRSPEVMYTDENGFSQFVEHRLSVYKQKGETDLKIIIGDICNY